MNHLLIILVISVAAAGSMQGSLTKSSRVGGLAPGRGGELDPGRLQLRGAVPGSRREATQWEHCCAGFELGVEQCGSTHTVQFCGFMKGGADYFGGAFVGAGVYLAFCLNFEGCYGGEILVEIGLLKGGPSGISADILDNDLIVGPEGSLAEEQGLLGDYGVLEWLRGDPPDPGEGACGSLRWWCRLPGWRHGLRGVRVGEASWGGGY